MPTTIITQIKWKVTSTDTAEDKTHRLDDKNCRHIAMFYIFCVVDTATTQNGFQHHTDIWAS